MKTIQIRGESPVGIVARTTAGDVVPIVYSAEKNIMWPHRIEEGQIDNVVATVRSAVVSVIPDGDAGMVATALGVPGSEAKRVLVLLSPHVGLSVYLSVVRQLRELGISPSQMPWRYSIPMLVSRFGGDTVSVIKYALPFLPVPLRAFGGHAGAKELTEIISKIWYTRDGQG